MAGMHRTPAKIRLGSAFVAVTAVAITAGTIGFGSAGAAVPVSQATGTFLGGSIVNTNLDNVVQLAGASAVNNGGPTVTDSHPLNATVLSAIPLDLGSGISLPLSQVIQLGAINQYAEANPDGTSLGASGTVSDTGAINTYDPAAGAPAAASLDLSRLLPASVTDTVANVQLSIGAIAGTAQETSACNVTRDYELAGVKLDVTSPLVSGLYNQITTALSPLNTLITTLNGIGGIANVPTVTSILNGLGGTALVSPDGNLTVNLVTGEITLDVDKIIQDATGLALNDQPPNTELLPYLTTEITNQLLPTLTNYLNNLVTAINTAFNGITIGGLPITNPLNSVTMALVQSVLAPLTAGLNTVTSNLNTAVVAPIVNALTDNLLSLIVNKQTQTAGGQYTETALAVALPPDGSVVGLNLASATVGPNEANCKAPTASGINPTQGPETGGTTVTLTGTNFVQGGTTVTIGGITVPADQVTVSPDGTSLTFVTPPHAPGPVDVTATTVNGTTSPQTFTYLPAAPVITSPADGSTVSDSTPPISGTASGPDGTPITVTEGGTTICTTTVTGGTWTCTPTTPLADGSHTITATQTVNGAESPPSDPVTFTVNTAAPAVPAPVITSPADGSSTTDTTPPITGTGVDGATVTVTDENGNTVCTATVSGTAWSCTPTTPFTPGSHTITATQEQNGITSPASDPVTFTVTAAPDAPVITAPTNGSTVSDNTPPITGTATGPDGSTVTVTEGGTTICTATVTGGTWTCTPTTPLADGSHTIVAVETVNGVDSPQSAPVTFTVDSSAPTLAAPVITSPANGSTTTDTTPTISGTGVNGAVVTVKDENGNTVCTATVANGTWTCTPTTPMTTGQHTITATQTLNGITSPASAPVTFTIVNTAAAPPAPPVITSPTDGSTVTDSTPPITGTGTPGDTVTVTDENGDTVCTATVKADGTWTCTPTTPFTEGDHTITATQTSPDGAVSQPSTPVNFTVDLPPPPPVITSPTDGATTGSTPTVSGTGQPGATVTVTVDGNPGCTTTVKADGTWSCQITNPLGDGPHTISATQTDAGGTSGPDSVGITVGATTTPADNGGGLGGGTGGDLANTGTQTEFYLLLAAALISLGMVTTLAARRQT